MMFLAIAAVNPMANAGTNDPCPFAGDERYEVDATWNSVEINNRDYDIWFDDYDLEKDLEACGADEALERYDRWRMHSKVAWGTLIGGCIIWPAWVVSIVECPVAIKHRKAFVDELEDATPPKK